MELGVILPTWYGDPDTAASMLATVQEAERSGYSIAWVPELYGADAVSLMAWLASHTERIRIGSAILQIPARQATMTAMTAATLESLFPGRIVIGLGISGPQVTEGWYGVAWDDPIGRTREYLDVVVSTLDRQMVEHQGRHIRIPASDKYRPIKLILKHHGRVPIFLAAMGSRNVRLAGERADGWLPALVLPERFGPARKVLAEGAARAGRNVDDVVIACSTSAVVTNDIEVGRNVYRPYLSLLIGGMGTRERNFYRDLVASYGYEEQSQQISDLYLGGHKAEAERLVPAELIDGLTLIGDRPRIKDRLAAFRDAHIDILSVAPSGRTQEEKLAVLRTVAELQ